jgi:type IV pilus assembly protein PilM
MIFNLFRSKSKLGVDIGTSSIKIVELSSANNRFTLENYGIWELKGQNESEDTQSLLKLPDDEIIWGIREVLKTSSFTSRDVVASIPSFSTFATVIQLPYLSEEDLAKAIPFEARKYVPIPLDEVVLDWSIVGIVDPTAGVTIAPPKSPSPTVRKDSTVDKPTVEVFLAAVPKDQTARYQRIMQGAGLNLVALELENAGLIRGLLGNDLVPSALINIGGRSTSIVIVNKGYERLSHNYEVGGFEITKAIAQSFGVSLEEAEDLKRTVGLNPAEENNLENATNELIDMIILETQKTISTYEESKNQKIERVVLVGGLVNMPYFVEHFKEKIQREVYVGNVFSRIVHPSELTPVIQELSNNFSVAAGLAMREM